MTTIIKKEKYGFDFDGVMHKSVGIPSIHGYPATHSKIQENPNLSIIRKMDELMNKWPIIEIISSSGAQDGIYDFLIHIFSSRFEGICKDYFMSEIGVEKKDLFQKNSLGEYTGELIKTPHKDITNGILRYNEYININTNARLKDKSDTVFDSDVIEFYDDSNIVLLNIIWKFEKESKAGNKKSIKLFNVVNSLDTYYEINMKNYLDDINNCFLKSCVKLLCDESSVINDDYVNDIKCNNLDIRLSSLQNADPEITKTLKLYINIAMNDFTEPSLRYIYYHIQTDRFKILDTLLNSNPKKKIVYPTTIENDPNNHTLTGIWKSDNSRIIINNLIIMEIKKLEKKYNINASNPRVIGELHDETNTNFCKKTNTNGNIHYLCSSREFLWKNKKHPEHNQIFDIVTSYTDTNNLQYIFKPMED
jgi:hypothetical protein